MGTDHQQQPHSPTPGALPIVILPGLNNTAATWVPVVRSLRTAGLEAAAYDLPIVESTTGLVAELSPLLPERFTLVGHSFGGYVALEFLAAHPDRVAAICLVNSSDRADTAAGRDARYRAVEAARSGGYRDLAAGATAKAYHHPHLADPRMMAARERDVEQYGVERFIAHQTAAAARTDHRRTLDSAARTALVVAATNDTVIPTRSQRAMAAETGAAYTEIGAAGHMLPAEQPDELAAALLRWLT